MDYQQLLEKITPFIKKNLLVLALGLVGMIFFAYGLIGLFVGHQDSSENIVFEANSEKDKSAEIKTIFVDIEGAVVKPGLYKVPQDSRIQDSLVAAGGLSGAADREYIAKNINLAIKLTDGAKIYIPSIGESVNDASVLSASSSQAGTVSGLININNSSQSELESLPGIGPVTAQKIIGARPYGAIDELLNKKIVGAKVYEQIKEKVSVY